MVGGVLFRQPVAIFAVFEQFVFKNFEKQVLLLFYLLHIPLNGMQFLPFEAQFVARSALAGIGDAVYLFYAAERQQRKRRDATSLRKAISVLPSMVVPLLS